MIEESKITLFEIEINLDGVDPLALYGENEVKLKLVKKSFPNAKITSRGTKIKVVSDEETNRNVKEVFQNLITILKSNNALPVYVVQDLLGGNNPMAARISETQNNNENH